MSTLHRLELIGNVGKEPEMRYNAAGTAMLTVRVAVDDSYGRGESRKEVVAWYDVELYGEPAEKASAAGFHKGDRVFAEGRPEQRAYVNQKGEAVPAPRLRFARLVNLEKRQDRGEPRAADAAVDPEASVPAAFRDPAPAADDDLPF